MKRTWEKEKKLKILSSFELGLGQELGSSPWSWEMSRFEGLMGIEEGGDAARGLRNSFREGNRTTSRFSPQTARQHIWTPQGMLPKESRMVKIQGEEGSHSCMWLSHHRGKLTVRVLSLSLMVRKLRPSSLEITVQGLRLWLLLVYFYKDANFQK